jgi:ADP-ribosylglycohydrolase
MMERVQHSLLNGAVGDSLGYIVESDRKKEVVTGFRDFVAHKGGRFNHHKVEVAAGDYTDDTEYTIATATSILSADKIDPKIFEAHLAYYAKHGTTGGMSMKRAGGEVLKGSLYDDLAKMFYSKGKFPYWEQKGTGVLMRVAPFALALADQSKRVNAVYENGILTHGSAEALMVAALHCEVVRTLYENPSHDVATAMNVVLNDGSGRVLPTSSMMEEWMQTYLRSSGRNFLDDVSEVFYAVCGKFDALEDGALSSSVKELVRGHISTVTALDSFLLAIVLSMKGDNSLDEKLISSANLGREIKMDTDTVCALVGQIGGVSQASGSFSVLENAVQDGGYISNHVSGHLYKVEHAGLQVGIDLVSDWRKKMVAEKGLWHPVFREARILEEEVGKKYTVRRVAFLRGKTMVIKSNK